MEDLKVGDVLLGVRGGTIGFGWQDYKWKEIAVKKVNKETYTLENGDIIYKNKTGEYFKGRGKTLYAYTIHSDKIIQEAIQANLDRAYEIFNRDIQYTDKDKLKYCLERKLKEISEEDERGV